MRIQPAFNPIQNVRYCNNFSCVAALLIALGLSMIAAPSHAATYYWSGTGNWNTTNTNWGTVSGGPYNTSTWGTINDDAVFEGTAGTVTLTATNPSAHNLTYNTTGYTITGGTLTLGGGTTPIITTGSGISATISSNVAGTAGFTKEGAGTLTINTNSSNTITGTISINAGTLSLVNTTVPGANTNKLATTAVVALGGGSLTYLGQDSGYNQIQDLAGLTINAGSSSASISRTGTASAFLRWTGNMSRSVGGTVNFSAGTGTAINTLGTTTNTNSIAGGFATFGSNTWAVYAGVTNGSISGLGSYTVPASSTSTTNVDVTTSATLAGVNSAANTLRFNTAAATTLSLSGAATITSGGILVTSAVGNNASTISGGTSLAGAAGADLVVIQNNTSNTLTIATNIVDNTTATGLTKSGAGSLIVTGTNGYTGDTFINAGTLEIGGSGTLGSGSYAGAINNRATLNYNSSAAQTLSGAISGTGLLIQNGAGTLELSGTNSYQGTTTVNAGTLLVNGTHNTAGAYSITGTGILGGGGIINSAANAGITLAAGTKLSPGSSPGPLTANVGTGTVDLIGAITATNSLSMLFDLDTTATSDKLVLSNALSTLAIGTGLLEFNDFVFTTTGSFGPGTYTLFDTGNTISGTLGTGLSGTVGGYSASISLANSNQDIVLTVVPEPGTFAMLLFGGVMMWFLGRKRTV